jgi:hypothetical protein
LVYPFHLLVLDGNSRVSIGVEQAIFCLVGGGGKAAANHQDKRESHIWTLVSVKASTTASGDRDDDDDGNNMFV